jgi:hypothetical protein
MKGYDQWKTASPYDDDKPNQKINDLLCDGTILIGYGKPGHGMNGKDADLDAIGQFLVKQLEVVDPIKAENMKVLIHCRLYCNICPPDYDYIPEYRESLSQDLRDIFDRSSINVDDDEQLYQYLADQATEIICGMHPATFGNDPFACMWTGEEWSGGVDVTLEVPLTVDEYEIIEGIDEPFCDVLPIHVQSKIQKFTLGVVANRIAEEIFNANKGGTPARDQVKLFEEEVALAHKLINQLTEREDETDNCV